MGDTEDLTRQVGGPGVAGGQQGDQMAASVRWASERAVLLGPASFSSFGQ